MSYRKFNADHLFTGSEIIHGNGVLITDLGGKVLDIVDKNDAGDDIEVFKGLLTPGFINSHCHIELSHMKDMIPDKTGLVSFVQQVMSKRGIADELKFDAMRLAEQELYNSGTVAVGDICNTTDSIDIKQKSKMKWHNFIEVSGFTDALAEKRFEAIQEVAHQWTMDHGPWSIVPHAPYSVSKKLFQLLNEATANQLISIHNQESEEENKLYEDKSGSFLELYKNFGIDITGFEPSGKTSFQTWLNYFTNNQSIILVHNTFTNQEDLDFVCRQSSIVHRPLHFCLCPNANKYIEGRMPPIDLLRKNNCNIVIGTDSYASNWQLNMLEEIKTIQHKTAFSIPLEEILRWSTINAARALQMDNELGSFEKNKNPGVILIDEMNGLNVTMNSSAKRLL
ncbi:amidohydrolase family protein [Ferruginibacter sp. SUN002]|uniref:amidohydrolase family protein n=1 Tax=Ferruginibacter sp. SUN002 TaxID=2937789 RepID=UPI003D36395F